MNLYSIYYTIALFTCLFIESTICEETTRIPTSCVGLQDGYHYVQLLEDDAAHDVQYPILYVLCSNEYVMIDYSIDSQWSSYFSTFVKYHYGVVGPVRNDQSNWMQWFLPDITTTEDVRAPHYLVSPWCQTCDASSVDQVHNDQSAYYMSALAFGCFAKVRGLPACDFDYNSYQCKICDWDDANVHISSEARPDTLTLETAMSQDLMTGICDFEIRHSAQRVSQSFSHCAVADSLQTDTENWKPSLGIDGRFCECFKPNLRKPTYTTVPKARLQEKMDARSDDIHTETDIATPQNVKLYQSDFEEGTYRILQPGTYTVMEDIQFDFNSPPKGHASPNNIEDNFYWPTDVEKYPGAMSSRDPFFMGFFAGITVECDDVILDLNGFELRMSDMFYYQQPFFSVIELSSQAFLPQQGPGFYGANPHFAQNIVIKNGILGLSSHHAIHGNYNGGVVVDNVHIRHFQTHGIQLNGFDGVEIKNVEIGPSTQRAYLNGNYGQIRLLLPAMAKIAQEHKTDTFTFTAREDEPVTMQHLVDRIVKQMDMVLDFALTGATYHGDEEWDEAVRMFINPSGLPMGAVLYGLFLNYPSAGIFGWHVNDLRSSNVKLESVHIHDLRHKGIEVLGLAEIGRVFCNAFNGPIPAQDLLGDALESFQSKLYSHDANAPVAYAQYAGSIITDIHIAMYYLGRDDFDHWPGIPFYGDNEGMLDWALGKDPYYMASDGDFNFYCNEDAMFHPSKGLLGIKISGVDMVRMQDVRVEELQDETPFGSELCGEGLDKFHGMYHFAQQMPYQIGFSMNMVMAITIDFSDAQMEDIAIHNIASATGLVYGFAAWFQSNIELNGHMSIKDLNAGVLVRDSGLTYSDLPNKATEACAIRLYDDDSDPITIHSDADEFSAEQSCIDGQIGCKGLTDYTTFGDMVEDEDSGECSRALPFELAPSEMGELMQSRAQSDDSFMPHHIQSKVVLPYTSRLSVLIGAVIAMAVMLLLLYVKVSCNNGEKETDRDPNELTRLIES